MNDRIIREMREKSSVTCSVGDQAAANLADMIYGLFKAGYGGRVCQLGATLDDHTSPRTMEDHDLMVVAMAAQVALMNAISVALDRWAEDGAELAKPA